MISFEGLLKRQAEIQSKRLVVGFDGYVDTIARPIRQSATEEAPAKMFETIREFGEFLIGCAEKSGSIELKIEAKQLGGNLPFLSRSAGKLGLEVTAIGMLGEEGVLEPQFQELPCTLYSYAAPGQSTAFEFRDGKVFFASEYVLPGEPWQKVLASTEGRAPELFRDADLIALLNWSELSFSQKLWESVYTEACENEARDKTRYAFFDLCDCSRRTKEDIHKVLLLIGRFSTKRTAILSLNENEAHVISARLLDCGTEPAMIGAALREKYGIDEILVHTIRESIFVTSRGITRQPTEFVEFPKISAGAGDNFNAASCFGALLGMIDEERVAFANRYSSFYVSNGYSPTLSEILLGENPR